MAAALDARRRLWRQQRRREGGTDKAATARGPITYVQGKDNSNVVRRLIEKWNAAHPDEKVTFKEQTDQADQQHDDLVQHFQAKDPSYDVVSVDVVWTAEFAAKGWLQPLKGELALDTARLLQPTVDGRDLQRQAVRRARTTSDGGMLYYRTDLVQDPAEDWDEMMGRLRDRQEEQHGLLRRPVREVRGPDRQRRRGDQHRRRRDRRRRRRHADRRQRRRRKAGLQMLADDYKNGDIPKEAITYQEEQGRQAFEAGKLLFLRNWPYVYNLATTDGSSKVKGKFAVAPLPGVSGPGASTLGGHSAAISVYSQAQGDRARLHEVHRRATSSRSSS